MLSSMRGSRTSQIMPALSRHIRPRRGVLSQLRLAVPGVARSARILALKQLLTGTMALCSHYERHPWQIADGNVYRIHYMFNTHHNEQQALANLLLRRIAALQGFPVAHEPEGLDLDPDQIDAEDTPARLSQLLAAHESLLTQAAETTALEKGDGSPYDLTVEEVIRINELHVWALSYLPPVHNCG